MQIEHAKRIGHGALVIDSYRAPEEVPGGPPRPGWIVVADAAADNSANVVVYAGGGVEFAKRVADEIVAALPRASQRIDDLERRAAAAEAALTRAAASLLDAERRLDAVLHGRRRLFGEALVRVDDAGAAWLLDPQRQERGIGLHFPSLADLWRAHPELRPVRWSGSDLIVDGGIAIGDKDGT
jgi:hypothetical protein